MPVGMDGGMLGGMIGGMLVVGYLLVVGYMIHFTSHVGLICDTFAQNRS